MNNKLITITIIISSFLMAEDYLDAVNMSLYSEYYYEGVMVEFETILETDSFPKTIEFTLPVSTDSVFFISGIPTAGSTIVPIDVIPGKKYTTINLELSDPQFRIFIFANPFQDEHERSVTWPIKADIQMKNVHVTVQEPVMADEFKIKNEISASEEDQHGIMMHQIHLGDISANQLKNIDFTYHNHSGKTTIKTLREQLSQPQKKKAPITTGHNTPPKRHTLLLWEPLAILGVLTLIIGIMFYKKNTKPISTTISEEKVTSHSKKNFCSSCGNQLSSADKFCSNCGGKI